MLTNGIAPRQKLAQRYTPNKGTRDAVADFVDWMTDPKTGQPVTELGEEAVTAVSMALLTGNALCPGPAFKAIAKLRVRNGQHSGPDIPENHQRTNGLDFRGLLEELQGKLEALIERQGPER